jgi:hypothetical protein
VQIASLAFADLAWRPNDVEAATDSLGENAADVNPQARELVPIDPEDLVCEWGDGLPADALEAIQEESQRLSDGTQDVVDAIMRLDGLTYAEAEEKAAKIKAGQPEPPPPIVGPGLDYYGMGALVTEGSREDSADREDGTQNAPPADVPAQGR